MTCKHPQLCCESCRQIDWSAWNDCLIAIHGKNEIKKGVNNE